MDLGRWGKDTESAAKITSILGAGRSAVKTEAAARGLRKSRASDSGMGVEDAASQPRFAGGLLWFAGGRPRFAGRQPRFAGGQPRFAGGQLRFAGGRSRFAGHRPRFAGGQPRFAGDSDKACSSL